MFIVSREQSFIRIISGQATGPVAGAMRAGLACLEPAYTAAVTHRNKRFDRGHGVHKLDRPVISVGNLTTGGTGKTPVVTWVCEQLKQQGVEPCVLMRGYRAKDGKRSDEAMEYDARGILCEPDPDRVAAAKRVLASDANIGAFVLDDGYQHRRVHRDLNLLVIDATRAFGFGHVLPRGLLREPRSGVKRASAVILTRVDQARPDTVKVIEAMVKAHAPDAPIAHTTHEWVDSAGTMPLEALKGTDVVAACGIGNPEAFQRTLTDHAANVVAFEAMGDHHDWTKAQIDELAARGLPVVTTHKDWVKWQRLCKEWSVRICVPQVGICFQSGEDSLVKQIQTIMGFAPNA